ncbi:MAG: Uma2 family endonuclease [Alkalinema sp. RU_4_3]|nr:Uma2 family endonuclease [Alkalinema sp. RU_4_3]
MVQAIAKPIGLEEFLQLPETKPASEYIDGQILQKPMPQGEHSTLQRCLTQHIDDRLSPDKIAHAYPELRCTFGGRSTVPDIAVFCWENIPRQPNGRVANRFEVAPDWTIEVLSPDQSQTKVTRNVLHCLDHGTKMGWIIDAEESCIFVCDPNKTTRLFDEPQMILPVPVFAQGIKLTVEEVFAWLVID